ncbi:hypothetical protein [Streptomyces collinus]|uniref:Uncharacterized protein n=1 Tax=Streptomyces collinus (strain DSM 40733 / Tue 365) TaxID=1214242 RepID=S5VKS9_STRC3|nr:hypothetical protein [Streptomyces collinus]AGS71187.1 hypothetical protein B446_21875 [Streptomyces collinus Tu 365]
MPLPPPRRLSPSPATPATVRPPRPARDRRGGPPARRRTGEPARFAATRFDPAHVAHAYEDLFARLDATRRGRARTRRRPRRRGRAGRPPRRVRP